MVSNGTLVGSRMSRFSLTGELWCQSWYIYNEKSWLSFFRSFSDGNRRLIGTVIEWKMHFIKTAQTEPTHTPDPHKLYDRYVGDEANMDHRKHQVRIVFRSPIAPNLTDFRNRIWPEFFIFFIFEQTGFLARYFCFRDSRRCLEDKSMCFKCQNQYNTRCFMNLLISR